MRTAIVHDWLPVYAGAERVLEQMLHVLPEADLFSLIEFLPDDQRAFLQGKPVQTSFLQRLPFARRKYRTYLPFAPLAIEQFDLSPYDVVVSSSYVVAKGVLTSWKQLHISYVHSPVRYAWDLYWPYLRASGLNRGPRGLVARLVLHYLRLFDAASAPRVDVFVANSRHVARRIWKTYRRRAAVIHPPADTDSFELQPLKDDYYVTVSRLVPYKRIDMIVRAFSRMPERRLVVIGDGPEMKMLRRLAGPNVSLLGHRSDAEVRRNMQDARAFVFAAEEDFGIAPVEAQACGTPVLAYGVGGIRETVIDGETGLFFAEQSPESICAAVAAFEADPGRFDPYRIRAHAEQFSVARFRASFSAFVERSWERFEEASDPTLGLYEEQDAWSVVDPAPWPR